MPENIDLNNTDIRFIFISKYDTEWAKSGHILGFKQFNGFKFKKTQTNPNICPEFNSSSDAVSVITDKGIFVLNKYSGLIEKIIVHGENIIASAIKPNFWRAPLDNDRSPKTEWYNLGLDRLNCDGEIQEVVCRNDCVVIASYLTVGADALPPVSKMKMRYSVFKSGAVNVSIKAETVEEFLPRFGFEKALSPEYDKVTYYGYGPTESYIDKNLSTHKDVFSISVADNFEAYERPQENSAHFAVSYFEISSNKNAV